MKRADSDRAEVNSGDDDGKKRRLQPEGGTDVTHDDNNDSESGNHSVVSSSSSSSSSSASSSSNSKKLKDRTALGSSSSTRSLSAKSTTDTSAGAKGTSSGGADTGVDTVTAQGISPLAAAGRSAPPPASSSLKKLPRQILPWDQMFQHLIDYSRTSGTCNVAKRTVFHTATREIKLGQWLSDQRKAYTKNKLLPARLEKIQDLVQKGHLRWGNTTKGEAFDIRWNKCYAALYDYGRSTGTCNVSRDFSLLIYADGLPITLKLGNWLHKQRSNKKNGKLDSYKAGMLQELVDQHLLVWDHRSDSDANRWELNFNALLEFFARYGHCNVPPRCVMLLSSSHPCKLGAWLKLQRAQDKDGKLKPERAVKLANLVNAGVLKWGCEKSEKKENSGSEGHEKSKDKQSKKQASKSFPELPPDALVFDVTGDSLEEASPNTGHGNGSASVSKKSQTKTKAAKPGSEKKAVGASSVSSSAKAKDKAKAVSVTKLTSKSTAVKAKVPAKDKAKAKVTRGKAKATAAILQPVIAQGGFIGVPFPGEDFDALTFCSSHMEGGDENYYFEGEDDDDFLGFDDDEQGGNEDDQNEDGLV
jgi:hypothetical protein